MKLDPGNRFLDLDLPDHSGRPRLLSELAGGDPLALLLSRGWWCPKEQRHLREVARLQDEFEVAYARIVVVSVDAPEVQAAFRAGLGARSRSCRTASGGGCGRSTCSRRPTRCTVPTGRPPSRCIRT